jgi:hypothetical protein
MKIFNPAPKKGMFAWICSSQAHVLEGQDKEKGNVANRSRLSPTYHKRSFCFVYASASASLTIPFRVWIGNTPTPWLFRESPATCTATDSLVMKVAFNSKS